MKKVILMGMLIMIGCIAQAQNNVRKPTPPAAKPTPAPMPAPRPAPPTPPSKKPEPPIAKPSRPKPL